MLPPAPCRDCNVDVRQIGEECMLQAPLWYSIAGMIPHLCLGCFERRLGRTLNRDDFDMHYQQNNKPNKSERMVDRMARRV